VRGSSGDKAPRQNKDKEDEEEKKEKFDAIPPFHFVSIPGEEEEAMEDQTYLRRDILPSIPSFGANVVSDAVRAFGNTVVALAARPEVQPRNIKGVPSTTVLTAGALAAASVTVATEGNAGGSIVWMAALLSAYSTWTESVVGDVTRALGTWSYEIVANILIPTLNEWNDYRQINRRAQIMVKDATEKRYRFPDQWNRFQDSFLSLGDNVMWETSKAETEAKILAKQIDDSDRKEARIVRVKSEGFTARLDEWTLEQVEKATVFETPAIVVDSIKGIRQSVVYPLSQLEYGVRSETCFGAATVGVLVALSQGGDVNEIVLASILALYLSLSQGVAGDTARFVGTATFDVLSLLTILAKYVYGPEIFPKLNSGNFGAFEIDRERSSRIGVRTQNVESSDQSQFSVTGVDGESTTQQTNTVGMRIDTVSSLKNLNTDLVITKEAFDTKSEDVVDDIGTNQNELNQVRNTAPVPAEMVPVKKEETALPIEMPSTSLNKPLVGDEVASTDVVQPTFSSPGDKQSALSTELPKTYDIGKTWAEGGIPQDFPEEYDQDSVISGLPLMRARTKAWIENDGTSLEKLASTYQSMATTTSPVKEAAVADAPVVQPSLPPTRPRLKPVAKVASTGDPVKAESVARKLLTRRLVDKSQPGAESPMALAPLPPTRPPLKPALKATIASDTVKTESVARSLLERRLADESQPVVKSFINLASPPPTRPPLKQGSNRAIIGDPVKAESLARELLARRLADSQPVQTELPSPAKQESTSSTQLPKNGAMVKAWSDGNAPLESSDAIDQVDSNLPRLWASTKAWAERDGVSFGDLVASLNMTYEIPIVHMDPSVSRALISEAIEEPCDVQGLDVKHEATLLGESKPSRTERDSISIVSDQERLIGSAMFEPEIKTPRSFSQRLEAQPELIRPNITVEEHRKSNGFKNPPSEERISATKKSGVNVPSVKSVFQDHALVESSASSNVQKVRTAHDLDSLIQDVEHLVQELRRMKEEKLASEAELVVDHARSFVYERNLTDARHVL